MSKKGMKEGYLERINKRKPKPNQICKVHKGKHVFDTLEKRDSMFNTGFEKITNLVKCECGKKEYISVPLKNGELLESFVDHCKTNPTERFWQALRNWSKYTFIFGSKSKKHYEAIVMTDLEDTFSID